MPSHAPRKVFTASNRFRHVQQRTQKISLHKRILFAATITLIAALAIAGVSSNAADPASGTISVGNPTLTYQTGPNLVSNPSGTAELDCENLPCDEYALTINVPASYANTHQVRIHITWPNPAEDYDLNVSNVGSSGAAAGVPETVIAPAVSGNYIVQVVPFAVAGGTFTGTITLEEKPPAGGGGGAVTTNDSVRFQTYTPPAETGLGNSAGEPSVGFGKPSAQFPGGRYMFIAGLETLRVSFDDCASPAKATWEDKSAPTTSVTTLDPILESDKDKFGRVFVSQLLPKTSSLVYTDDDGETYTQSATGSGINPGVDHQTVGVGPFVPGLPDGVAGYPSAVYYASQDIAVAQLAISRDGGLSFGPAVPMYNLTQCGGLHGHVTVGPDGTAYIPNKGCTPTAAGVEGGGVQGFALTEDEATTFKIRTVPGSTGGNNDPSIGIGRGDETNGRGRLYFGYSEAGRPKIAVSDDKGVTFSLPIDVGTPFGIRNIVFPQVVAGDDDRASFMFLGTPTAGDYQNMSFTGIWHMYIATTYDGGATWTTVDTTPNDPVQIGSICTGGTTCGEDRNLLDFNDLKMDYEGRIVGAYADGCVGCDSPSTSRSAFATIVRQSGGKRLLAQFDPPTTPSVPLAPRVNSVVKQTGNSVRVDWDAPDNGGAAITGYKVFRKTGAGGTYAVIATVAANKTEYIDTTAAANQQYFYKVTATNSVGESGNCGEFPVGDAGPTESPCTTPGVTIAVDPAGDNTGNVVASQDLRRVSVAEPFFPNGSQKLVFTLKVEGSLSPTPPPNTVWYAVFTFRGVNYFVNMNTGDNPAQPTYEFGRVDFDGTINQQTGLGPADAESTFTPDGTIILVLSTNKIDEPVTIGGAAQLPPVAGDALANVKGEVRALVGAGGSGLITVVDDTGASNYTLVGNNSCAPNNAPVASLNASPTAGSAPLTVNFDASGSSDADSGDTVASYTFDFGDGSPVITRTGANAAQVSHVYQEGNYRATLKVTDSRGKESTNTAGVNIEVTAGSSGGGTQRTFVSTSGNDSNTASNCSRTQPCRSFAAAISRTNSGGEVVVLDSGGYGGVTITRSVTIAAPAGVYAGVTAISNAAITVGVGAADTVVLRGLTLNGLGAATGVLFSGGGALHIEDSVVNGFTGSGINFVGGSSTGGRLYVKDSQLRNNGGTGVRIQTNGTTQTTAVVAVLDRVRVENNGGDGVVVGGNTQVTVKNSVIAGNINGAGLRAAASSGGLTATLLVENCLSSGNQIGIAASGSAGTSTVRVSRTTVSYNQAGLSMSGVGGSIISRGNNTVEENDAGGNGAFSSTVPPK